MQLFNVISYLSSKETEILERLAWEYECHCITHEPPNINDWPGELNDLPTEGCVISIISFNSENEAITFNKLLQDNYPSWNSVFQLETILPWMDYHRPFMEPIQLGIMTISPTTAPALLDPLTLYLPAGLGFGTGRHATTQSCLLLMQQVSLKEKTIIDFGCGSGILSLAAVILGSSTVQAHDHDLQALQATSSHAEEHQISDQISIIQHARSLIPASVLLANILYEPLILLYAQFLKLILKDGYAVFSGILEEQSSAFKECYSHDFIIIKELIDDGWYSVLMQKKSES